MAYQKSGEPNRNQYNSLNTQVFCPNQYGLFNGANSIFVAFCNWSLGILLKAVISFTIKSEIPKY